jgi:hypothetical protein
MDGHTFISWNIPNFVTIVLMAALGVVVLKTASSLYKKRKGAANDSAG